MKIYLDIDGTLIDYGGNPAPHLREFLEFVVTYHEPFWLSAQCQDGDASKTLEYLSQFVSPQILELARTIKPTNWEVNKTEALVQKEKFFWLDDDLYDDEHTWLIMHDLLDSWIPIDLADQPNALLHALKKIKGL